MFQNYLYFYILFKMALIVQFSMLVIFQAVYLKTLSLEQFSYLIIVFTKRKVGAHIAMPIKGNVHLLFHNAKTHDIKTFCLKLIVF